MNCLMAAFHFILPSSKLTKLRHPILTELTLYPFGHHSTLPRPIKSVPNVSVPIFTSTASEFSAFRLANSMKPGNLTVILVSVFFFIIRPFLVRFWRLACENIVTLGTHQSEWLIGYPKPSLAAISHGQSSAFTPDSATRSLQQPTAPRGDCSGRRDGG